MPTTKKPVKVSRKTSSKSKKVPVTSKATQTAVAEKTASQVNETTVSRVNRLSSVWRLARSAAGILWRRRKVFMGIALVYVVCNTFLVQTASATNLVVLKDTLASSSVASPNSITTGLTLFSVLLATAGTGAGQAGAAYQSILLVIVSLAIIWALRETFAGRPFRIRDSFYRGMYPLVPYILVVLVIFIQLIPLAVGAGLFGTIVSNGIATNGLQLAVALLLPIIGIIVSAYFLTSSLFAGYIVTLPDMTPLRALRSARDLVNGRRWTVIRKIFFLPIVLVLVGVATMLPIILFLTPAAPWIFFIASTLALLYVHSYLYALYRELIA